MTLKSELLCRQGLEGFKMRSETTPLSKSREERGKRKLCWGEATCKVLDTKTRTGAGGEKGKLE